MWRRWLAVSLVGLLLSAGCLGLVLSDEPVAPDGPHVPWTSTTADPWVMLTAGCGFCSGNASVPEVQTVVVYEDGHVLWFRFGMGPGNGPADVSTVPGLAKYEAELERIVPDMDNYYSHTAELRVHEVATSRLTGDEWSAVSGFLQEAVAEAEDPGPPNYDCVDCGGYHVQLLGAKDLNVILSPTNPEFPEYGNFQEDDAWGRILAQTRAVGDWVEAWKEP